MAKSTNTAKSTDNHKSTDTEIKTESRVGALLGGLSPKLTGAGVTVAVLPLFFVAQLPPKPIAYGVELAFSIGIGVCFGQLHALLQKGRTEESAIVVQDTERQVAMQRRAQYLSALVDIEQLLLADEGGEAFEATLPPIGKAAHASRIYLTQIQTKEQVHFATLRAEWCAPGIASQLDSPTRQDVSLTQQFPRWLEALQQNEVIHGAVRDFPQGERRQLETQGIFSLLLLPLRVNGALWGFLGLENRQSPRLWEPQDLDMLKTAASALVQAQARRENEQATMQQALHDPLTGLSNRRRLREKLDEAILVAQANQTSVIVVYMDLDRFKQINDTLGHAFGDRFLQYIVKHRLIPCIGKKDLLARVGGDEFVLVMSETDHPDIVNGSARTAESLLKSLTEPVHLEGQELVISTSIGISRFPTDGADADTLLKHADVAMYKAKEEGRGDYRFFTSQMNRITKERFELEADLRHDLVPGSQDTNFTLHYQPQVDVSTGRMIGVESLVRWRHAKRGIVSPAKFIPIAEETGLISGLGDWVLETACLQGARWVNNGCSLRVAVNLSAQQLRNRELPNKVAEVLARTGLAATHLDLELTETALVEDIPGALAIMNALKEMGICLSLDDFGAGYSSLSHLRHCPFDVVKIDRSFVKSIVGSIRDQMVVKSLIGLAHDLGITVLAEGVETTAQCEILHKLGCNHFQGYLFSPPIPSEEIERKFLVGMLKKAA
jgi:diguanylate cyclase (GGDEF)-like protein